MTDNHHLDENLKRMLKSAFDQPSPAFQADLVRDVLAEVARQRQSEATPSWWRTLLAGPVWRPVGFAAAAASLLVAGGLWLRSSLATPLVGRLSCLYGLVAVQNGDPPRTVQGAVELKSGQRVRTQAGSKAQIQLQDQSRLIPDPRTSLQVTATRRGPLVLLEQGALSLEAAKQLPGKAITIEASRRPRESPGHKTRRARSRQAQRPSPNPGARPKRQCGIGVWRPEGRFARRHGRNRR